MSELHPECGAANDEENTTFVEGYLDYLLSHTANGFERQYQVVLDKHKVSRHEWRILCCISEFPDANMEEMSILTLIPEKILADNLNEIEKKGWVRSNRDKDGNSRYLIEQTGLDLLVPLLVAAKSHESDALSKFSAQEVRQFKSMLKEHCCPVNFHTKAI